MNTKINPWILFFAIQLSATALLFATELPQYHEPELVARANGHDTYQLPAPSYLNSTSPALGDNGAIAFKLMSVYDRGNQGVWYRGPQEKNGNIVYEAAPDKYVSDGQMNARGEFSFSVFDEVRSDGVFVFDPASGNTEKVFAPKGTDLAYFGDPQRLLNGALVFRATTLENDRRFYTYGAALSPLAEEGQTVAGLQLSYLFGPTVSESGQWAFKARLGEKKNWSESSADRVLLLIPPTAPQSPDYQVVTVAEDKDSNPQSPYEWFGNVVSLSNDGSQLVFVSRVNNKKVIVQVVNGQHNILVTEGQNGITQIEPFNPEVNNNGVVAFRAKDEKGLRGVYVASSAGIQRLVGEGDMVISDQGKSLVMSDKNFPGLAGDVDINNRNEILFSCVLKSVYDGSHQGSAIFILKTK